MKAVRPSLWFALVLFFFTLGGVPASHAQALIDLGQARSAKLARGVSLPQWYSQSDSYHEDRLSSFFALADAKSLKNAGITHLRVTISPEVVGGFSGSGELNQPIMTRLRERVRELNALGLAVVLDIHPSGSERQMKANLKTAEGEGAFLRTWANLAAFFAGVDPNATFFEVLNEPELLEGKQWRELQLKAVNAVREKAPDHTIIVNPGGWSTVNELFQFRAYSNVPNLIYTVHWYEPFLFTHQGSNWSNEAVKHIKGVGWPLSATDANRAAQFADTDDAKSDLLNAIRTGRFEADTGLRRLNEVASWRAANGNVPIYVGEFGVIRRNVPVHDRNKWHAVMRKAFDLHGFGWAVWDYATDFGIANGPPGQRVLDPGLSRALGLQLPLGSSGQAASGVSK